MQIQRLQIHTGHTSQSAKSYVAGKQSATSAASSEAAGSDRAVNDSASVLASTVDRVRDLPEVRADVVAAARARLANGDFNSREVAEQTAASILDRA